MIIRAATQADLTTIIPELGKTFAADPSLGWILRESDDPQGILEAFYGAVSEHALSVGYIDVAEEDGEFLGASVWMPPSETLPLKVLRKSLPAVKKIGKAVPTLVKYLYASSKVSLPFPSWHLEIIVVNERARGRGIGSRLLDHGIERVGADAARLEATSQRSAKLYTSRGFIVLGEVKTPAPTPEIIMWRPASSPYVPDRS
ncbi:GNAT family N-acetyltransferase [Flaviflexus massiliensis]|uniref:GNAT family N-acetyltransferase n=1 Tax=Flaviflexus massiliensis TaxID=1522309 RepID=UPI0006D57CC4|nr:GNAT family N-acetyltransferase [Flaviflexus massiliensis]